ncbi:MAG: type II secretion system protein [Telluria sp.]
MKCVKRSPRGFTLIELLASAAILGILAAVAVPVIETTVRREKEHALRQALRDIRRGIDAYKQAAITGHVLVADGESGYPPALQDLVNGVPDELNKAGPRLYFLRRIPRDPFFANSNVSAVETWGKRSYDSPPDAPRAGADVFDVYSTSALTGLNGVPYAEW